MRKWFVKVLFLFAVAFFITTKLYAQGYRVVITNPNNQPLTNYQVRINLSSYLQSASYLKVVNAYGVDLPFCYEQPNGECNTTPSKVIWVKVNYIPANGQAVLYIYNNQNTNYAVNGDQVFDFYDDFDSGVLASYWVQVRGIWTIENGWLNVSTSTSVVPGPLIYENLTTFNITQYVIDSQMQLSITDARLVYGINTSNYYYVIVQSNTYNVYAGHWKWEGAWSQLAGISPLITFNKGDIIYYKVYSDGINVIGYLKDLTTGQDTYANYSLSLITDYLDSYIGFACGANKYIKINWVRVRKYAPIQPTVTIIPAYVNATFLQLSNRTYYTSLINDSFSITANIDTYAWIKEWIDGLLKLNQTVHLPFVYNNTVELLKEGVHNITVWAQGLNTSIINTQTVLFNLDLYDENVTYSNYKTYNLTKYVDTLDYDLKVRCGALGHTIAVSFYNNTTVHKTYTITCDNKTHTITDAYRNFKEGLFNVSFYLNAVNSLDSRWFGNDTFVADLLPPEIHLFNYTLTEGFRDNLTERSYFDVTDSISPFVNCSYSLNAVEGYRNESKVNYNKVLLVDNFTLSPNNDLKLECKDIVGHVSERSISFPLSIYKTTFVDEYNNNLINFSTFPYNLTVYVYLATGTKIYNQSATKKWKNPMYLVFSDNNKILETLFQIETTYARLFIFPFTTNIVPETLLLTSSSNIYVLEFVPFTTQDYYIEIKDSLGRIAGWAKITPTTAGYAYLTPAHKYFLYQLTPDLSVSKYLQDILMTYSSSITIYDLPSSITTAKTTNVLVQKLNNGEIELIYKSPTSTPLKVTVYDMYYSKIYEKDYPPSKYIEDVLPINLSTYPLVYVEVNNTKQTFTQVILGKGNTGYNPKEVPYPLRDFAVIFSSAALSALFFTRRRIGYAMVVFGVMMTVFAAVLHASAWVGYLGAAFVSIGILYILILRQVL